MKFSDKSGYDYIAPLYDDLAGLIFGKEIFDAQVCYFNEIPKGSKILVLGGGTGWILPILINGKHDLEIVYIDSSSKMIELARKQVNNTSVQFICATEEAIPINSSFDVIITNFYLDGFSKDELPSKLKHIQSFLKPNGIWIATDFVNSSKRTHQAMLWLMHFCFGLLMKHPNRRLVNWEKALLQTMPDLKNEIYWKGGFIRSILLANTK